MEEGYRLQKLSRENKKRRGEREQESSGDSEIKDVDAVKEGVNKIIAKEFGKKVERIAKVCHEVNRAYCLFNGDNSQVPWEETPDWQRDSCFDGVRFHLNNPDVTPEMSHQNWLKHKIEDGWRYGAVKDIEKKQHPCMVPYFELPSEQRVKDSLFKAVVDAMR